MSNKNDNWVELSSVRLFFAPIWDKACYFLFCVPLITENERNEKNLFTAEKISISKIVCSILCGVMRFHVFFSMSKCRSIKIEICFFCSSRCEFSSFVVRRKNHTQNDKLTRWLLKVCFRCGYWWCNWKHCCQSWPARGMRKWIKMPFLPIEIVK